MTSTTSTTLPGFVQAAIDGADESVQLNLPEGVEGVQDGTVTIARLDSVSVRIAHKAGEIQWHVHGNQDDAKECYAADVAHIQEMIAFVSNGGDPIALHLRASTGMPLEMAVVLAPQVRARMEQEPDIPVPTPAAIGRASVAPQVVTVSDEYDFTGFYL